MPRKPRVTKQQMKSICEQLGEGRSLMKICQDDGLPSWRTVLRHIQDDDQAHDEYRKARAIQAEMLRDEIIDIIEAPLPDDPKLAHMRSVAYIWGRAHVAQKKAAILGDRARSVA